MTVTTSVGSELWAILPLLLGALLGLAGFWALSVGLRGRRIDDHPLCRNCGFDLTGRAAGSDRCPECGSDVTRPTALRHGHRQRRGGLIAAGAIGLLLAMVFVAPPLLSSVADFSLQPYKPLWLLRREATKGDASRRDLALAELDRRMKQGELSTDSVAGIVALALDVQADASIKWNPKWGDLIERSRSDRKVSDAQWARYARQAVHPTLTMRSKVGRGDPIRLVLGTQPARLGNLSPLQLRYDTRLHQVQVNDVGLPQSKNTGHSTGSMRISADSRTTIYSSVSLNPIWDKLPDGANELRFRTKLMVRDTPTDGSSDTAVVDVDLKAPFDIRPRGEAVVATNTDESLRAGMLAAVSVEEAAVRGGQSDVHVMVMVRGIPEGLGHHVFVRSDGQEVKLGSLACPAGTTNHGWGFHMSADDLSAVGERIDVIFRPDPTVAAESHNTYSIWGGELEFKDVKVERPNLPTTTPADGR